MKSLKMRKPLLLPFSLLLFAFAASGPELSGLDGKVTFGAVEKPSDAAGFFTIGVSATKGK